MNQPQRTILHVHFDSPADDSDVYQQLLSLLEGITPRVQALPPDAADLDLSGAGRYWGRDARGLAQLIKLRVLAHYGIHTTMAAAPNRLLASMATDATEPGGIAVIDPHPDAIRSFLRPRPVAALHGVGPATVKVLTRHGIHTIGDLADTPPLTLQRLFGTATGRNLHERAHGRDARPVVPQAPARTISTEHRFAHDELDAAEHRCALLALAEQLGIRLRSEEQVAGAVTITVRYADRSTTTRSRTLPEPTAHSATLTSTAYVLYDSLGLQRARVRTIAVRAEALSPAEHAPRQLTLDPADDKARRIEAAADAARRRFGPTAVKPASLAILGGTGGGTP
ncbi:DNA polymerase Y family protein [Streptomyces olivoreticuli]|uniref:DNA polymerase Y family protein n=1 Tax=Streptomyces olivoreticuli TaxID=68246 RepID=UPI000E2748E3|nr:hypothetical protein [Streptomyces olivoreticuli]